MLVGYVDLLQRIGIAGWVGDTDHPASPVEVAILLNGQECARVRAATQRADIQALGRFGDGPHGFEYKFEPPLSALRSYDVRVQFASTTELVPAGHATLLAEPTLFTEPVSPILVSANEPTEADLMLRALSEHHQIVVADLFTCRLQLLSYYARAAEVMNSPAGDPPELPAPSGAADNQVIGRNPFHHHAFQQMFPRKRMLHEFFARSAGRIIGTAFKSVVVDLYLELAGHQHKHEVRYFAERNDLFDVTADFARIAFGQTTNIVLTRDPRDVYCAARDLWFNSHAQAVQRLRHTAERMRWFGSAHRDETIFIKFEDFLAMPDQVLGEVWNIVGVNPANQRLNEETIALPAARASAGVGLWKTYLDRAEIASVERELGEYMGLFGYELSSETEPAPA